MKLRFYFVLSILLTIISSCTPYNQRFIISNNDDPVLDKYFQPLWISGTEDKSKVFYSTFPKNVTTEHFSVINAGFWVYVPKNKNVDPFIVRYEYTLNIKPPFTKRIYTKVILANPKDTSNPFVYKHYIDSEHSTKAFHAPVEGLEIGKKYKLTFEFYEDEARTKLLERVSQTIESPLDSRNKCVELASEIKSTAPYKWSCN